MNAVRRLLGKRAALFGLLVAGVLGVALVSKLHIGAPSAESQTDARVAVASDNNEAEVRLRFNQGVVMLHAKQYDHALTALQRTLELAPHLPEAHVNKGFAWLGLSRFSEAQQAFTRAIDLRPQQANAYYGLALALEGQRDLRGAICAMRTYLHLGVAEESHARKARSALWEWEESMKTMAEASR